MDDADGMRGPGGGGRGNLAAEVARANGLPPSVGRSECCAPGVGVLPLAGTAWSGSCSCSVTKSVSLSLNLRICESCFNCEYVFLCSWICQSMIYIYFVNVKFMMKILRWIKSVMWNLCWRNLWMWSCMIFVMKYVWSLVVMNHDEFVWSWSRKRKEKIR
jgi:hypothetical protein